MLLLSIALALKTSLIASIPHGFGGNSLSKSISRNRFLLLTKEIYSKIIGKVFANVWTQSFFVSAKAKGKEGAIVNCYSVNAIALRYILAFYHITRFRTVENS